MKLAQLGVLVAVAAATGTASAQGAPFCASGGAVADDDPACISFEEAAALAAQPDSGVHRVTASNQPTLGSFVTASADDSEGICSEGTCYVRGEGTVSLHATATTQMVFQHWSGCSDSAEPVITIGPLSEDADCVANFGPGLIVVGLSTQGREDGVQAAFEGRCAGQPSCTLMSGNSVTISAPPSGLRYRFVGWSGCSTSESATLTLSDVTQPVAPCVATYERRVLPRLWLWR